MLRGVQIVFISAVVIITLLISIWNAADLRSVLDRSTKQYLYDVTIQTTREISDTMNHRMEDLKAVADSAARPVSYTQLDCKSKKSRRKRIQAGWMYLRGAGSAAEGRTLHGDL